MAILLSDNIEYKAPKLADNRVQFNGERPYSSLEEAWETVPIGNRALGLRQLIKNTEGLTDEWVYKEGVENDNLVLVSYDVDLSNYATKSEVSNKVDKVDGKDLIEIYEINRLKSLKLEDYNNSLYSNMIRSGTTLAILDTWDGVFTDSIVGQVILNKLGIIRRNYVTNEEIGSIDSIDGWFTNNKKITTFNEFKYFTGIKTLDNYAFAGCSSLTSIILPSSIIKLGDNCFDGCESLTSLSIPENVTTMGSSCFNNTTMTVTFLSHR